MFFPLLIIFSKCGMAPPSSMATLGWQTQDVVQLWCVALRGGVRGGNRRDQRKRKTILGVGGINSIVFGKEGFSLTGQR